MPTPRCSRTATVGWYLIWVVNSRERLARLRQIAGSMKDAMLSGRCWGVAIGDVADRGADAEVLAVGAGLEPRRLRGVATDPKARRSEYEVGSDAWVRLLANGGREDIGPLWHGVDRPTADSVEPAVRNEVVEAPGTGADPTRISPSPDSGPPDSDLQAGEAAIDAVEVDADIEVMLVPVWLAASGRTCRRAARRAGQLVTTCSTCSSGFASRKILVAGSTASS
jgi:hypothetical protein